MELTPLIQTHPAIQRRLIREALRQWQGHLQRMAAVHIEAVINLVSKGHCGGRLNLPHGLVAQRTENHLRLYFQDNLNLTQNFGSTPYSHMLESKKDLPAEIPINACNGVLRFTLVRPPTTKELEQCPPNCAWLDADTLQFPLIIRNARPGDRLAPLGLRGTQKIKDVFINAKVSRQGRWNRPLVISNNEVLWVAGLRRSNLHLVMGNTRQVLAVEWDTWSPTYNGAQ
jgi:tRNA(Ile)-lysidine synthase